VSVAALRDVTKRFGAVAALDGVTLDVHEGDVLALLGPNGAGKSTAIALLLGLRAPDAGSALLFGVNPRKPAARRLVGVTPQETAFPLTLRVSEVVELVRSHFAQPLPAALIYEQFELDGLVRRQVGGLSGGERRRVAVALAFAGAPKLVVLDEPTTGLDRSARNSVWDAIGAHADRGGTVVLTTHYLEEADALARRVVLIEAGKVIADGGVAEIKAAAGLTRVSYRCDDKLVQIDAPDGGQVVEDLVSRGVPLVDLEVRPLSLEEALAVCELPR